jgi:hypothetical protein
LYFKDKIPLINGFLTKESYVKISIDGDKMTLLTDNNFDKNISISEEDCSDIGILNKIEVSDNKITGINNCNIKYEFAIDWKEL